MPVVKYKQNSPYFATPFNENHLDIRTDRPIPKETDDQFVEINQAYQYRPDLLAYDLYQDSGLWWVFAQRNPDQIEDPIYDFKPGVTVQLPKKENLLKYLGI